MSRALRLLLLWTVTTAGGTGQPPGATDDDATRCGSALGRQRAEELKMDEHLLALVQASVHNLGCLEDMPTGVETACPAAVLSRQPLIVSVPLTAPERLPREGKLLQELLEAQPSGVEREDGWHMSPKGVVSTEFAAVLAEAVRCRFAACCVSLSVVASVELCDFVARWVRRSMQHIWSHCKLSALLVHMHRSTTMTSCWPTFLLLG